VDAAELIGSAREQPLLELAKLRSGCRPEIVTQPLA
jgi:hypothetical protein